MQPMAHRLINKLAVASGNIQIIQRLAGSDSPHAVRLNAARAALDESVALLRPHAAVAPCLMDAYARLQQLMALDKKVKEGGASDEEIAQHAQELERAAEFAEASSDERDLLVRQAV